MSVRNLVDAIIAGDSIAIDHALQGEMSTRISNRLDAMRKDLASNLFLQQVEEHIEEEDLEVVDEAKKTEDETNDDEDEDESGKLDEATSANTIHVQPVSGGKYKVHKVGKSYSDHIKQGEHLTDSELDDFREMGGTIKHVKG